MSSTQNETRARRRSLQHFHSMQNNHSLREAARQAVETAAQDALCTVYTPRGDNSNIGNSSISNAATTKQGRRPSTDSAFSKVSHSSFLSYQRAIHRGSNRGLFEPQDDIANSTNIENDGTLSLDGLLSLEHRTPTAATATATASKTTNSLSSGKKKQKWFFMKKALRPKPNPTKLRLTSELSKEAWMCGVCAKSFSSFAVAQRHEAYHIQEVVADLGWDGSYASSNDERQSAIVTIEGIEDKEELPRTSLTLQLPGSDVDTKLPFSASEPSALMTPQRNTSTGQLERASLRTPTNSSIPRPDMLRMSSAAHFSSAANHLHPYNTPALQRKRKSKRTLSNHIFEDSSSRSDDFFLESAEFDLTTSVVKPSARSQTPMTPIDERKKVQTNKNQDQKLTIDVQQQENDWLSDEHDLLVPHSMRNYVVLADEALTDVCEKAKPLMLTSAEQEAERELEYLARDKAYYDMMYIRSVERQRGGTYDHFRAEGKSILSKVQNKFVDAYQLMKDGKAKGKTTHMDHYTRKLKGDIDTIHILENSKESLYVNVIVKASLKVVSYELQRLAKQRWEAAQAKKDDHDPQAQQFQQFRAAAQDNLVKLAGMALASDFTPRRIAVQLSNDLYRLLTPRLKRRGVTIETEIEYRVGPYFVLAVNVKKVDWRRLVKAANRDVEASKSRWKLEQEGKNDDEKADVGPKGVIMSFLFLCYRLSQLTKFEVMAQFLAWCYYFHWALYTPICFLLYHSFLGELFRRYFLATVSDEIFYYVEQKGMEMDIDIRNASTQTAFMLSALREIRADGRELKKKRKEGEDRGTILGPLLGPAIKEDKGVAPPKPEGFEMPENLEDVGLELEIPVGFRRLRWALLASKSTFVTDAVFRTEAKYENITVGSWSKYNEEIGMGTLPEGVKEEDVIGAEKELSYLMPKSAFVKANMCYETAYLDMYNDYCFVLRKKALTPEVPYGSTFVAWTKYIVINTGGDSCKLICSVEAEFPNGPPMISRQIKGGMRAGVGELFVKTGETINKYADQFP